MTIAFTVPAIPIAQPRQRHRKIKTQDGREFTQDYTPTEAPVNAFKATVRMAARAAHAGPPLDGPLLISTIFVMPRPNAMIWKRKPMPRVWRSVGVGDVDNMQKALFDALSKLIWRDDKQVCYPVSLLTIAAGNEAPHLEVRIEELAGTLPPQPDSYDPEN